MFGEAEYLRERVPLAGDRPSQAIRVLERALQRRRSEPIEVDGARKRFLEAYAWRTESSGWDQVVEVRVHGRSLAAGFGNG